MAKNPLQTELDKVRDPVNALAFLVDFAQLDPAALATDPRGALELRVQALLHREHPARRVQPGHLSRAQMRVMQQRTRLILEGLASGGPVGIAGDLLLSFYLLPTAAGHVAEHVLGRPEDLFVYQVKQVLMATGTARIKKCPACGRLFVKRTRKEFCSTRCQSRTYMRTFRARKADAGKATTPAPRRRVTRPPQQTKRGTK
jgi:hypothetical protein